MDSYQVDISHMKQGDNTLFIFNNFNIHIMNLCLPWCLQAFGLHDAEASDFFAWGPALRIELCIGGATASI